MSTFDLDKRQRRYENLAIEREALLGTLAGMEDEMEDLALAILRDGHGITFGTVIADRKGDIWKVDGITFNKYADPHYQELRKIGLGFRLRGRRKTRSGWHRSVMSIIFSPYSVVEDVE